MTQCRTHHGRHKTKPFWLSKTMWLGIAQIVYGASSCLGAAIGTWGSYDDAQWIATGAAMLGLRVCTTTPLGMGAKQR